jgi:hypothetical protein
VAVTAIKWDTALKVAWHEEFLNDPATAGPFAGQDPVMATSKLAVGDVVSTTRTFKPFISASENAAPSEVASVTAARAPGASRGTSDPVTPAARTATTSAVT